MKKMIGPILIASLLTACGGGGDDKKPVMADIKDIDVLTLWKSFLSTERTLKSSGTGSDGAAYEVITTIQPKETQFFGKDANAARNTYTVFEVSNAIKQSGASQQTTRSLFYVHPIDLNIVAVLRTSEETCVVSDIDVLNPPIPRAANLNSSGPMFSGSEYTYDAAEKRCTQEGVVGAPLHSVSWSYESDDNRPLFCFNYSNVALGNNQLQNICIELYSADSFSSFARISLLANDLHVLTKTH